MAKSEAVVEYGCLNSASANISTPMLRAGWRCLIPSGLLSIITPRIRKMSLRCLCILMTIPLVPARFPSPGNSTSTVMTSARSAEEVLPSGSRAGGAAALCLFCDLYGCREGCRGNVQEIHCTYDPASRGGNSPDGRKVKGTIHWVSVKYALPAEVRLYEQLFSVADPNNVPEGTTFLDYINPDSLRTVSARLEPAMAQIRTGETVQFERVAISARTGTVRMNCLSSTVR